MNMKKIGLCIKEIRMEQNANGESIKLINRYIHDGERTAQEVVAVIG